MREILFRGKKTTNGEWVVGNYARNVVDAKFDTIEDCEYFPYLIYGIDRDTVGQYTGLTDKNGKRIFEGDIVRCDNTWHLNREVYQVAFDDGGFYLVDESGTMWHHEHLENIEVIGNIHDNKELLHDCEV